MQVYPKISVLMPVYNASEFLDESINSILEQSFSDFELLILDDKSKDNSLQVIEKYAKQDSRIRVLKNKTNQGEAFCRNRLVAKSKATFIAWMDADDISFRNRLETQFLFLEKYSYIDVIGCGVRNFGRKHYNSYQPINDYAIKSSLLLRNTIAGPTTMIRKDKQVYPYDKKIKVSTDYHYWIKNADNFYYYNLPKILYKYRIHPTGLSQSQKIPYESHFFIMKEHFSRFGIKDFTKNDFLVLRGQKKNVVLEDLERSLKLVKQLIDIKEFYGYQGIDKEILFTIYLPGFFKSCSRVIDILYFMKQKKFIESCFTTFPLNLKTLVYAQCYQRIYQPLKIRGKFLFIKSLGFDYFLIIYYFFLKRKGTRLVHRIKWFILNKFFNAGVSKD